jgi:hypothetical protein
MKNSSVRSTPLVRQNWRTSLAWDGLLPMCITAITVFLEFLYPDDVAVELFALLILPLIGAIIRASVGVHQLQRFTGASLWWRQILLAAAIVLLLLMESAAALVIYAADDPDLPLWMRLTPAGIYACYLPVVILAFWKTADVTSSNPSSS